MSTHKNIIIDFDSTFTKIEAMDLLAEIVWKNTEQKEDIINKISHYTYLGMKGEISFRDSLTKRLDLLQLHRNHLEALIPLLKEVVSVSFLRNKDFFLHNSKSIYIISNGFKEFIVPVVSEFGIHENHVFANTFIFDEEGWVIGFDEKNILSDNNGKPRQLQQLQLNGEIYVIGDGYTDYEIKAAGEADKFYAFTENIKRPEVVAKADAETTTLDEFLYIHGLERAFSFPKSKIKVLMLENIHPKAKLLFENEGYQVEINSAAMEEDELCEKIKDVSILCIRSKTQVTEKVISHAKRLLSIGAFCIGTNQINLKSALHRGISVFNAPYSNTRSVVELAIAEMIMLIRNIPDKAQQMHNGKWDKSASNSFEIRGKTLGIVGYGNIGSQLSVLAESMGLKVIFYDVVERLALGNAQKCHTLDELLEKSDIISLHVDGRKSNHLLFGQREFEKMKNGVIFINLSRGYVVDIDVLRQNILSKKIIGCAIDVFPYEPVSNHEEFLSPLRGLPNTILTPHIGGSTLEAQENIGTFVPNRILDYINTGSTTNSVNFPNMTLPALNNAHRLIHIHKNIPGILAKINQILASHALNIEGQYLKTNEEIGYVITDINKNYDGSVVDELKKIEGTIRFRILY